ncbi:hypothetical protein K469DRAFT_686259 [Zopfia rhizophila CBS 207.26]|uniref:Uncharacterized protein n=1 Tax=Zopfia rhizophila CBS 207.26 TaxID=1314779 RepID=A0A6A6E940_9PEZI|nr:hypothetical protein K469DRAFT_686259 [Zopfia rhizophila CBS 207.26]
MIYLPTEILAQIPGVLERQRYLQLGDPPLAPLATLNHEWQNVVEAILWRHIKIKFSKLADLQSHMSVKPVRRQKLRRLEVFWFHLFNYELEDEEPVEVRLQAFQDGKKRFFVEVQSVWEELVSWNVDLGSGRYKAGLRRTVHLRIIRSGVQRG